MGLFVVSLSDHNGEGGFAVICSTLLNQNQVGKKNNFKQPEIGEIRAHEEYPLVNVYITMERSTMFNG